MQVADRSLLLRGGQIGIHGESEKEYRGNEVRNAAMSILVNSLRANGVSHLRSYLGLEVACRLLLAWSRQLPR